MERYRTILVPLRCVPNSERWRAQAAIQLSLAAIDGSEFVVLDRADLLDSDNRKKLIKIVSRIASRSKVTVVLCSTGDIQPMEGIKLYRIENGVSRQVQ